jgi:hypothetical protein
MENKLSGTVTVSSNNLGNFTLTPNGTSTSTHNLYSTPELIKTIVKKDTIELIYKRQYMVSNNCGMPNPEVYKDIYSRFGGDVRREIGTYVPAQDESYVFDSDLM